MDRSPEGCGEEWEGGDVVELGCAWTTTVAMSPPHSCDRRDHFIRLILLIVKRFVVSCSPSHFLIRC